MFLQVGGKSEGKTNIYLVSLTKPGEVKSSVIAFAMYASSPTSSRMPKAIGIYMIRTISPQSENFFFFFFYMQGVAEYC
jgi:hypothetical protein